MRNLLLEKNSFQLLNDEMKSVNENLQLLKGIHGKTLEFYSDEGVKKVFDVHHYNKGNTILFKK